MQGYAIHDPEVDCVYEAYTKERSCFLVIEKNGVVLGGGGIQQLKGGESDTCELQRMYLLPEARGKGAGEQLLHALLSRAKSEGFSQCYLETTASMQQAKRLYEKLGFLQLSQRLGSTGHCACEGWYLKKF